MSIQQAPARIGRTALRVALSAAFGAAVLASSAAHAVVVTVVPAAPIPVPFNIDGVYLNVVTGVTGTSAAGVPGWDLNPYYSGSTGATPVFNFFASTTGDASRGIISTPLSNGASISTVTSFATGAQAVAPLAAGIYNFGFRFTNESTAAPNVGYVTIQIQPPLSASYATILGWAYENAGQAITVSAVPEPTTWLLMAGGLAAVGASLRKRRAAAA